MLQLINTGRKSGFGKTKNIYQIYFEHVVYVLDE